MTLVKVFASSHSTNMYSYIGCSSWLAKLLETKYKALSKSITEAHLCEQRQVDMSTINLSI